MPGGGASSAAIAKPDRRALLAGLFVSPLLLAARAGDPGGGALAAIEARVGGRLGVAMLDTGSGATIAYRASERFRMCSTFKLLLAACVLARVDRGQERLERRIAYGAADLVAYSPITERHVADGMTVAELCHAAITVSDNGAANLLLRQIGGPAALTAFLRASGDAVTRLDRIEPALNDAPPGDPRDSTTPLVMVTTMRRLLLGDLLQPSSRARLVAWLIASTTGAARLRAGTPTGWAIGDKTGTWSGDSRPATSNDVAILWPPGRAPILIAAFLTECPAAAAARDAALADVARIVMSRE